jgi:DNA polymerase V
MGLPNLEHDNIKFSLNLNDYLLKNPTSTFFISLETDTFAKYGFYKKDILIVDRSINNSFKPQLFESEGEFVLDLKPKQLGANSKILFGTVVGLARKI